MIDESLLRAELIRAGGSLEKLDLNRGLSGNISVRCRAGMLISASGASLGSLRESDIVLIDEVGRSAAEYPPSSEWRFHRDIYAARPEVSAVVHTHSFAATVLACLRKEIPPFHYMVLRAGGRNVPCADYATFGTQDLSGKVVEALAGRKACLLANHGMIAIGAHLNEAVAIAAEVEALAATYIATLQIGEPILLTDAEMKAAEHQFRDLRYGTGRR